MYKQTLKKLKTQGRVAEIRWIKSKQQQNLVDYKKYQVNI